MDIEIFPHRILGTDTTEKVLNDLESLDSVKRTVIQGPRLPPQDEIDRIYGDRRVIVVNGEEVELKVKTGRIFVELYDESAIDEIRAICDEHIDTGFDINTSKAQYIRKQRSILAFTLDTYGHVTEKMQQDSADRMQRYLQSI